VRVITLRMSAVVAWRCNQRPLECRAVNHTIHCDHAAASFAASSNFLREYAVENRGRQFGQVWSASITRTMRLVSVAAAGNRLDRSKRPMSGRGHSRHFGRAPATSGFPRLADILRGSRHVSKGAISGLTQSPHVDEQTASSGPAGGPPGSWRS